MSVLQARSLARCGGGGGNMMRPFYHPCEIARNFKSIGFISSSQLRRGSD
jgi:hypothetical protein